MAGIINLFQTLRQFPVFGTIIASLVTLRSTLVWERSHGRTQQMGQYQAQKSRHRRQARQDLDPPHQGNHGCRPHGRRRCQRQPAAAAGGRQGSRRQHAQGQRQPRHPARHRRPGRRQLRRNPLRRLRHQRRRHHRRLHDRQPRAHRGGSAPRLFQVRRQHGHRRFGRLPVQALRPAVLRARHR